MSKPSRPKVRKLLNVPEVTVDQVPLKSMDTFTKAYDDSNVYTVRIKNLDLSNTVISDGKAINVADIEPIKSLIGSSISTFYPQDCVNMEIKKQYHKTIELVDRLNEPETKCKFWIDYNLFPFNNTV